MTLSYLAFEGIDGAGKHEQIELHGRRLIREGVTPVHLLEPSYGPYGREIRRQLHDGTLGTLAEQRALFTRDRRDHVECKIAPLLEFVRARPGFAILQSRTYLSAAAYQAESDDPAELIAIIDEQRAIAPEPDIVLILDLPVDAALARLHRLHETDSMEQPAILKRARRRYRTIVGLSSHYVLIDASGSRAEVAQRIADAIAVAAPGDAT